MRRRQRAFRTVVPLLTVLLMVGCASDGTPDPTGGQTTTVPTGGSETTLPAPVGPDTTMPSSGTGGLPDFEEGECPYISVSDLGRLTGLSGMAVREVFLPGEVDMRGTPLDHTWCGFEGPTMMLYLEIREGDFASRFQLATQAVGVDMPGFTSGEIPGLGVEAYWMSMEDEVLTSTVAHDGSRMVTVTTAEFPGHQDVDAAAIIAHVFSR